jgi:ABC-2 type transport system ATP-binding protein
VPTTTTSLQLSRIGKRYGRGAPFVLRQVDASLSPGDVVHVRGGNGSGKSTLLRIVAGVSAPTRGRVLGRPANVGFVPERFPPTVRFTPRDYLSHLAAIRRTEATDALDLLAGLGAGAWIDVPMTELSKGSCQKVALAQALTGPPGLLVLDEAWTGLDTAAQAVLTDQVRRRTADGDIVVLTDHARRTTAVRPTLRWLVVDGDVTDAPAETAADPTVVVLLGDGPDLSRHPGVSSVAADPGRLVVHVHPGWSEELIAEALRGGWSVHEVRPAR